jgi:hypothetical protein
MANLRIKGDVSGYVDLVAPDVAGSQTVNLDKLVEVNSNGYLGVGTTTPTVGLELSGTGNATRFKMIDGSDQVNFGLWDGSNYRLEGDANRKILITSYHTDGIHLGASGGSDLVVKGNKVGIGTTSPQEKLEVNGVLQIRRDGDHPALRFAEINSGTTTTRGYIASGDWAVNGGAIDDFGISGSVTGDLLLATNAGTERLRIQNSTGNVGINTTNPSAKLHIVDGNNVAQFGDLNSNSTMSLRMSDTSGSPVEIQAYSDTLRLRTHPSGGSMQDRLTILSGGNVGIGTTNPQNLLHLETGSSGETRIRFKSDNLGGSHGLFWVDENAVNQSQFYYNHSSNKQFLELNGNGLQIYSKQTSSTIAEFGSGAGGYNNFSIPNGNVGIGTSSPYANSRLHVFGTTADTGTGGGSQGLSIATGGGTSCPIYFGSETNSAQKSMYMTGYWIYLRGHQNEGIRFVFSQGGGTAPRSDQYQFKYNSAYRPTGNTTWDGFSDARAKENVTNLTGALDTISQLRPVTFDWTDDYADTMNMFEMDTTDEKSYNHFSVKENGYDLDRKTSQIGFIAQEFEEVFPKSITETEMQLGDTKVEDFKTVNYDHLIPVLTKAIQELKAENDALKARIEALEGQ